MIEAHFNEQTLFYDEKRERGCVLLIVNPDYEQRWGADYNFVYHVSRNTRNGVAYGAVSGHGIPATARFVDDRFVNLTCELQWWIHSMNCELLPPSISDVTRRGWFRSMFRDNAFITNHKGTTTQRDCINNINVREGWPQYQPMSSGGGCHRISGEKRLYGEDCWLIDAINPDVEYSKYHYTAYPWLFFPPTLSVRQWIFDEKGNVIEKREWFEEPMHFYNEQTRLPVFGFIPNKNSLTGYSNAIQKWRCRILRPDESAPNPFIMRDARTIKNPYEQRRKAPCFSNGDIRRTNLDII